MHWIRCVVVVVGFFFFEFYFLFFLYFSCIRLNVLTLLYRITKAHFVWVCKWVLFVSQVVVARQNRRYEILFPCTFIQTLILNTRKGFTLFVSAFALFFALHAHTLRSLDPFLRRSVFSFPIHERFAARPKSSVLGFLLCAHFCGPTQFVSTEVPAHTAYEVNATNVKKKEKNECVVLLVSVCEIASKLSSARRVDI